MSALSQSRHFDGARCQQATLKAWPDMKDAVDGCGLSRAGCSRERVRFISTARVLITFWFRLFQTTKRAKTIGRSDDPGKHMGRIVWEFTSWIRDGGRGY